MKRQVITGPRMSGKTTKLLEAVRDFAYQPNKQILVLTNMHHESCMLMKKFSNDNRFYVESRIEDPVRRVNFKNGSQIQFKQASSNATAGMMFDMVAFDNVDYAKNTDMYTPCVIETLIETRLDESNEGSGVLG